MSLNSVILPAFVIAELYADSLVITGEESGIKNSFPQDAEPINPINLKNKSVGDNLKNILIVHNHPGIEQLPTDEFQFLTGILAACKLTLTDVALINFVDYPLQTYKELIAAFKSKIVLLVDISPLEIGLPMNFPHYQIQPFAGNSFLYAPSLKSLQDDKIEKTKLWTALKRLFNI
jgi:hypothetical protein